MEWSEVHDPTGEIEFVMEWTLVRSSYLPEEIQEIIDKEGVQGMVHIVNEHFKLSRHGQPALHLTHVNGRKAVIQF